jgi:hypothetical protein
MNQLILLILALLSFSGFSQSRLLDIRSDQFTQVFGFDLKETTSGYLVAGTGSSTMNAGFFCWITKTDQEFNTIWGKKFLLSGLDYQVNPTTVTISTLENNQIILLAKTRNEDSTFTELACFNETGDFLWGKKWTHPNEYTIPIDLNEIVPLPPNEFLISHSIKKGSIQIKLNTNGTVLSSKHTHLPTLNDTTNGVFNLRCNDGGMLQILRTQERKTILVRSDDQSQVSWSKQLESVNRSIWLANAHENSDGSFWLFGSITHSNPQTNLTSQVNAVMKLSPGGNLSGAYFYEYSENMGIAQIHPISEDQFSFASTEGIIGTINQTTGYSEIQQLDIFQANHGFQNLHKISDQYALTGLGANWAESKIQLFTELENHPCLYLQQPIHQFFQDTIPLQDILVTAIPVVITDYSFGNPFNPIIQPADITFEQECYLGLDEKEAGPELSIYPNPGNSGSFVTLKLSGQYQADKMEVSVRDLQGKEVLLSEVTGSSGLHLIDTRTLQAGMYVVNCKLLGTSKNLTGKLILR